ncbi:GATA zinc finger domain-containing protein 8-like [Maniola hyperantus]|uniref:GATA zinc finger domain-containing protein 8-like n=1 Tax=Aphantopus hyperantus TaxID=2795564 RepID=UPI0037494557
MTYRSHEGDDYKVNKTARDKKRQNMENENNDTRSKYSDEDVLNQFCTELYGIDCNDRGQSMSVNNHHSKFFTILNNHRTSQSSSNSNSYDGNKNAVEIMELNSDEDETSENEQQDNHNNSWCNITYRSHEGDDCKVNKTARDKNPQNMEKENNDTRSKYSDEDVLNQFCTELYGIDCNDRGQSMSVNNHHSKFFTILNNHRTSQTYSDSNSYDDIEVIQYDETKENRCWNSNDFYDNRNITYGNDGNAEKRTIWIYSSKNQRYLSEHDYELINISCKDSISATNEEEPGKDIPNHRRIATPFPTYIPRMNLPLSPTLPTVTEVTELNKLTLNNSDIATRNADENLFQRPSNCWFKEEITKTEHVKHSPGNIEKSYENKWQDLPARDRSRIRQSKINEQNKLYIEKGPETPVYCEPTIIIGRNKEFSPESHIESFETQIDESKRNEDDQDNDMNDEKEVSLQNSRDDSTSLCNRQKPQIKLSTETKTLKKEITYPIQKLDGNWIGQSLPDHKELLELYDYNIMGPENNDAQVVSQKTEDAIEECASYRLFIRNLSILNPAEWTQHLSLTGRVRVPSLHLSVSVDTDIDTEKKSWFKRFLDIVYCCK